MCAARAPRHVDTVLVQHQAALDVLANAHGLSSFDPVFLVLAKALRPTLARHAARKYMQTFDDPVRNQALRAADLVSPQVVKAARMLRRRTPSRLTNVSVTHLRSFVWMPRSFVCIEDHDDSLMWDTSRTYTRIQAPWSEVFVGDSASISDRASSGTLSPTVSLD